MVLVTIKETETAVVSGVANRSPAPVLYNGVKYF